MIRLLELYVLKCIGALDVVDEERLRQIEPGLHETYGGTGTWVEVIERVMNFPPSLPDEIAGMWSAMRLQADEGEALIEPEVFARNVVDANFIGEN